MRKVRLNRANPGQDNLFLRNRYFLYIEKWIFTKKSCYIKHCTYFLVTVLLLYFVHTFAMGRNLRSCVKAAIFTEFEKKGGTDLKERVIYQICKNQ